MTFRCPRRLLLAAVLAAFAVPASSSATGAASLGGSRAGGRLVQPGLAALHAIGDDAGGSIVLSRDPSTSTVVLNRFSPTAGARWDGGVRFANATGAQMKPDGSGGAIVAIQNSDAPVMTVARILSSGSIAWRGTFAAGVLASAGDGGAWVISQSGELFADGVTPAGDPLPRVRVTDSPDGESLPATQADGSGGVFLAWRAAKPEGHFGITLQHLSSAGETWQEAVEVAGSTDSSLTPSLTADGTGGVLVSWYAAGGHWVQAYDASGANRWARAFTLTTSGARLNAVAAAGGGATFVAWTRRLRSEPLVVDLLSVSYLGGDGREHWSRALASVDGGVLDVRVAGQHGAVAIGWQSSALPGLAGPADTDLFVTRVLTSGGVSYSPQEEMLASSFGPDDFGALVDGGRGDLIAVFTQAPCLRAQVSGVVMQRIRPTGERAFGADGTCP